jgi:hypothetical protein
MTSNYVLILNVLKNGPLVSTVCVFARIRMNGHADINYLFHLLCHNPNNASA